MNSTIGHVRQSSWQVPKFEAPLSMARRHPWCVVIPVINEGDRIRHLLERISANQVSSIADIIIVDGGSTDGSLDLDFLKSHDVSALLVKTDAGKLSAQLRCA